MAVSNSTLNAINLFSSTSVFNANKGSVGATDLNFIKQTTAELATEGGGIIAQSLGTNGYVKFANGLILQWGKSSSSGRATTTVTLPISMASAIYAVAISQAAASDTWSTWSSIVSNTQIKLTNNYGPGSWWLVTGKQQWGRNTTSATFPISFNSVPFSLACTCGNGQNNDYCPSPHQKDLTATGFTFGDRGYWWVVIGKQQWGYNAYGSATATFPLTMSATYSIVLGHYATGSIDKWNWGINSYSTSKFTFTSMPGSYGIFWCVIGKQQWGYLPAPGKTTVTITFPIAFTSFNSIARLSIRSGSSGDQRHCTSYSLTGFAQAHDSGESTLYMAVGK